MKAANFSLPEYFQRIGYSGPADASIATLGAIMRSQLFTVPFENLDVQAGRIVSLVPEQIVEKIVSRRRGGYCYELNGIFAMLLEALGIPYQFIAARPMFYPVRRPKTHMAIVCQLEEETWLCDLGFGSYGIRAPLSLSRLDEEIRQDFDTFKLSKSSEREFLLQARVEGEWANQYAFDLSEQEWIDFMPANYLNSTHPDTVFVQKLLLVLHTAEGREILLGDMLKSVSRDRVVRQTIKPEDIPSTLRDKFHLALDV